MSKCKMCGLNLYKINKEINIGTPISRIFTESKEDLEKFFIEKGIPLCCRIYLLASINMKDYVLL